MMNGQYLIMTTDEARAKKWNDLFGVDRLPVVTNQARWQDINGLSAFAYDLDLKRLSDMQRSRFAAIIAKRTGRSYDKDVKPEIDGRSAYPIEASGCRVLVESEDNVTVEETVVSQQRRPFLFDWLARLFTPRIVYG